MLEEKRVNLKTGEQKLFRKKHKGSGLRGRPESPERPQRRSPPLPAAAVTTGGCAPRPRPRAGGPLRRGHALLRSGGGRKSVERRAREKAGGGNILRNEDQKTALSDKLGEGRGSGPYRTGGGTPHRAPCPPEPPCALSLLPRPLVGPLGLWVSLLRSVCCQVVHFASLTRNRPPRRPRRSGAGARSRRQRERGTELGRAEAPGRGQGAVLPWKRPEAELAQGGVPSTDAPQPRARRPWLCPPRARQEGQVGSASLDAAPGRNRRSVQPGRTPAQHGPLRDVRDGSGALCCPLCLKWALGRGPCSPRGRRLLGGSR